MRYTKFYIILWILLALMAPVLVSADGMMIPPIGRYVQETGQKAVIFYEDGRETLVISTTFEGNASDFAWIVPTPTRPDISKGSDELFTSLDDLTESVREFVKTNSLDYGYNEMAGSQPVTVLETKKIEYYDITVLEATDANALADWLNENGYQYPESDRYILDTYIKNGWYFTAVKMDDVYLAEKLSEIEKKISATAPILRHDELVDCYDADGGESFYDASYVETGDRVVEDYCRDLRTVAEYYCFNGSLQVKLYICPDGCVNGACTTQHAGLASGHAVPLRLDFKTERPVYPLRISSIQIDSGGRQSEVFGILLYIITDNKQTLPKFDTQYAGWIEVDRIKNLAYDDNGQPWLEPNKNKYFLTKLFRNMQPAEMTEDLYFRQADDNGTVNAPELKESNWKVFGWVMGVGGLVFLVLLGVLLINGSKKE